jgi:pyrroloquinoline quinone (PQQ) biosynthesis protein C
MMTAKKLQAAAAEIAAWTEALVDAQTAAEVAATWRALEEDAPPWAVAEIRKLVEWSRSQKGKPLLSPRGLH